MTTYRLTQFAHGGGCACKIPPGELELVLAGLTGFASPDLLVGLDDGDDAAVVRIDGDRAVLSTVDFFTPVVDDAYDWGRIGAANALSDGYAMGGTPIVAVNLLCWPRETLPFELAAEVLRGGLDVAREAESPVAGGHSIDDPEPGYGMAVTGLAHPDRLLRNDSGRAGVPLSLTKPLGLGVLNTRHKQTGRHGHRRTHRARRHRSHRQVGASLVEAAISQAWMRNAAARTHRYASMPGVLVVGSAAPAGRRYMGRGSAARRPRDPRPGQRDAQPGAAGSAVRCEEFQ